MAHAAPVKIYQMIQRRHLLTDVTLETRMDMSNVTSEMSSIHQQTPANSCQIIQMVSEYPFQIEVFKD